MTRIRNLSFLQAIELHRSWVDGKGGGGLEQNYLSVNVIQNVTIWKPNITVGRKEFRVNINPPPQKNKINMKLVEEHLDYVCQNKDITSTIYSLYRYKQWRTDAAASCLEAICYIRI